MERIKTLNYYQKGIIIVMVAMILIFAVIYPKTISRVGYRYNDEILVPNQENGNIVYSGKINGVPTQFIVSKEKSIVLQHGDKTYGPYTMKEDPTAIPKDEELAEQMIGVEICNNDKVLFRGGVLDFGDDYWLYNEDGTLDNFGFTYVTGDGIERDENGCKETLRMSKKEKSEKNRKKLRNPENMGFSTFLFLKIDILGVAKK